MSRSVQELGHGLQQLVGNTRLVYLKHFSEKAGCNILAKCEFENPGGSIKDRAALNMILSAERKGLLKRGSPGVVVEGTAGNTGIGLALAARVFGYHCVICIAKTQSVEKKNFLRWAGAHLVEVPAVPHRHPDNYVHVAKRVAENIQKVGNVSAFYSNQWDNPDNRHAHFTTTGPEIYRQVLELTGRPVDSFSCAVGTGGTLSGVAGYLRSQLGDKVKIGLTDPHGAGLVSYYNFGEIKSEGSSISEGIGQNRITGNLEGFTPDFALEVSDDEMIITLQDLQKYEGLSVGMSAGINVAGAMKAAEHLGHGSGKNVVTVMCDLGQRYASKLYNESFLRSKALPVSEWLLNPRPGEFSEVLKEAVNMSLENTARDDLSAD